MCGIVGYVGPKQAVPLLMEGLKRLEYRGYDSAGLASIVDGAIERRRAPGKLTNLEKVLVGSPLAGSVALGHTRWATHGKPSEANSHPHTDQTGTIAVIHNGIIENYLEIKDRLVAAGAKFESETDTEVLAHLIEEKIKQLQPPGSAPKPDLNEPLLFEAVRRALADVKGAYAIAVLWSKAPNTIVAAKTASPLIIGLGDGENYLASDIPAFLAHTRKAVFLEDGEMAVLKSGGVSFFNLAGKRLEKTPITISWDRTMAEKAGYRHFMLKEINEQASSCEDTMRGRFFPLKGVLERECGMNADILKKTRGVHMIACGTAYHACLVGKYWLESLVGVPTRVETASEFRYRETTIGPEDLVIAVSQSGETADTLAAVKLAKEKGAKVLAICNTVGAALTRAADWTLYTHCGPELGVASTKAFIGQLTALAVITLHSAIGRGAMNEAQGRAFVDDLVKVPGWIRAALKLEQNRARDRAQVRQEGALPVHRPQRELPDRSRGRAEAQGDLLHPRRGLRRRRAQARADRADRHGDAGRRDRDQVARSREDAVEPRGGQGARRPAHRRRDRGRGRVPRRRERPAPAADAGDPFAARQHRPAAASRLPHRRPARLRRRPAAQPRQVGDRRVMELGVDLVEIARIRALARRNPKFLRRVFSAAEIAYCKAKKNPWPHFAVRFAAKEAVYKTLGKADIPLTAISVSRASSGRPTVSIAGKADPKLKLSLSHGREHAVAVAVRLA